MSISKFTVFSELCESCFAAVVGLDSNCSLLMLIPLPLPVNTYRVVKNPNYGWRALRLLSRRSPHFFQPTNQKFKSLADYLDSMVSKLAKELPVRREKKQFIIVKKQK